MKVIDAEFIHHAASCLRPTRQWLTSHVAFLACLVAITTTLSSAGLFAAEFIPLGVPEGAIGVWARSVSDDGSVVTGMTFTNRSPQESEVFRWTESTGIVGLGFLPGDDRASQRSGQMVSGDGSTIVGTSGVEADFTNAFIHTEADGMQDMGIQTATVPHGVSFDGYVVVGITLPGIAFRWTASDGMTLLGTLPGDTNSRAVGVSEDGSVVVGGSWLGFEPGSSGFIWTETSGMVEFEVSGLGSVESVSADGNVIGGEAWLSSETDREAFRWNADDGAMGLGWLPATANDEGGNFSTVRGINADGSMLVGFSGRGDRARAFLWSEQDGMQDLYQLFVDKYGLGASLDGWQLTSAQDISANGEFVVGTGINPSGVQEGWLARVPEPGGLSIAWIGILSFLMTRHVTRVRPPSRSPGR